MPQVESRGILSLLRALLITDPFIVLATVVMGSISVAASLFDRQGRTSDRVACRWARMLLRMSGVRVRISGIEHVRGQGSYVFVGNHLSLMDTPVILANIPARIRFLVHAKYVRLPFLGTHLRRTGHFPVVLEDVRASLKTMTDAARVIRERRLSVLVFPEGTRASGPMREFKEGAAYIAIKAGVPVIPFALWGTREVLPIGSIHVRAGLVDLVFGEPISPTAYTLKNRGEFTRLLQERVAALLASMKQQRTEHHSVAGRMPS